MRRIPVYGFYPMRDDELVAQPLALATVLEVARLRNDGSLNERYDFSLGICYSAASLFDSIRQTGPGVCLFSNYVWNAVENLTVSRAVKALDTGCITIHGGPSTPKYADACATFLVSHRHADLAVRGEGEDTIIELLDRLAPYAETLDPERFDAIEAVSGISFLRKFGEPAFVRTADRPAITDLNSIPSPYLSGFFDQHGWNFGRRGWSGLERHGWRFRMLILETNRGCPYGCTFCDWGSATLQKIRLFSLGRIRAELEWMAAHRVQHIYIADANFGMLPRDLDIGRIIAEVKERHGFPETVTVNYAKNGSDRLPDIFRLWTSAGIAFEPTVSVQSVDAATLSVVRRSNIKTSKYLELSDIYHEMNLPVKIQLMYGLPGSTLLSWTRDLQFFFNRLEDVHGFKTQMLPNSPMADPAYVEMHAIRLDERGYVISCSTFTEDDHYLMGEILRVYQLFHNFALLKWFLYCLQWEYKIQAVDYMQDFVTIIASMDYPGLRALLEPHAGAQLANWFTQPTGWHRFYREIKDYTMLTYCISWTDSLEAALAVQEALMPTRNARLPKIISLPHDFVAYIGDIAKAKSPDAASTVRFDRYPPTEMLVTDPHGVCQSDVESVRTLPLWLTNPGWELESALRRLKPSPARHVSTDRLRQ
jgi:hypothetical protein